jgi:putative CocE/NonD family hydrolase
LTRHGYAVVKADLRGGGPSDGVGALFSDAEAEDYYDLIEWVGTQEWSSGRVGLDGVSYLAVSHVSATLSEGSQAGRKQRYLKVTLAATLGTMRMQPETFSGVCCLDWFNPLDAS